MVEAIIVTRMAQRIGLGRGSSRKLSVAVERKGPWKAIEKEHSNDLKEN